MIGLPAAPLGQHPAKTSESINGVVRLSQGKRGLPKPSPDTSPHQYRASGAEWYWDERKKRRDESIPLIPDDVWVKIIVFPQNNHQFHYLIILCGVRYTL